MKPSLLNKAMLAGFAALAGLLLSPGAAHAQTSFAAGNNPQTDENILLNSGITGPTVFGTGNSTGLQVSFSGNSAVESTLTAPSNGQARVEATDGTLNQVAIQVVGGSFKSLIFNANNGNGDLVLDVSYLHNNVAGSQQFTLGGLSNGSNFGTLTTQNGQTVITKVTLAAANGFADLRQVRLGGATADTSVSPQALVPEPASMAMALPGLFPVGLMLLRRRKKAKSA